MCTILPAPHWVWSFCPHKSNQHCVVCRREERALHDVLSSAILDPVILPLQSHLG
jgi:hypothetical protein